MTTIHINRAPVMTLWAAVVAERLGYARDEALTLGRAVAGMNAQAKALRLGIREPSEPGQKPKRAAAAIIRLILAAPVAPAVKIIPPFGLCAKASMTRVEWPCAVSMTKQSTRARTSSSARSRMQPGNDSPTQ